VRVAVLAAQLRVDPAGPVGATALVLFAADGDRVVSPDLAGLEAADSRGGRYPARYTELARGPGATIGAVAFEGAARGAKTFAVRVGSVAVDGRGSVAGPWEVEAVRETVDEPGAVSFILPLPPVAVHGATYSARSLGGPPDATLHAIERPGAATAYVYARVDRAGGVGVPGQDEVDCWVPWSRPTAPLPTYCPSMSSANNPASPLGTAAPRFPSPHPTEPTAAARTAPPTMTPYPTPAVVPTPKVSRQEALDRVQAGRPNSMRTTVLRIDRKEARLVTVADLWAAEGSWWRDDPHRLVWIVGVTGEVSVDGPVGSQTGAWAANTFDALTGEALSGGGGGSVPAPAAGSELGAAGLSRRFRAAAASSRAAGFGTAPVRGSGPTPPATEAVLKVSCPDPDTTREVLALRHYHGAGWLLAGRTSRGMRTRMTWGPAVPGRTWQARPSATWVASMNASTSSRPWSSRSQ
jgi:hypothetical protein